MRDVKMLYVGVLGYTLLVKRAGTCIHRRYNERVLLTRTYVASCWRASSTVMPGTRWLPRLHRFRQQTSASCLRQIERSLVVISSNKFCGWHKRHGIPRQFSSSQKIANLKKRFVIQTGVIVPCSLDVNGDIAVRHNSASSFN